MVVVVDEEFLKQLSDSKRRQYRKDYQEYKPVKPDDVKLTGKKLEPTEKPPSHNPLNSLINRRFTFQFTLTDVLRISAVLLIAFIILFLTVALVYQIERVRLLVEEYRQLEEEYDDLKDNYNYVKQRCILHSP